MVRETCYIQHGERPQHVQMTLQANKQTIKERAVQRLIHINPLKAELNSIRHLLALVGARHIVHVSRIRVNYRFCFFFISRLEFLPQ